jgi:hypothetical protein
MLGHHLRRRGADALQGACVLASRAAHWAGLGGVSHELPAGAPVPAAGLLALNTLRDNPGATKQVRGWRAAPGSERLKH